MTRPLKEIIQALDADQTKAAAMGMTGPLATLNIAAGATSISTPRTRSSSGP